MFSEHNCTSYNTETNLKMLFSVSKVHHTIILLMRPTWYQTWLYPAVKPLSNVHIGEKRKLVGINNGKKNDQNVIGVIYFHATLKHLGGVSDNKKNIYKYSQVYLYGVCCKDLLCQPL